MGCKGPCDLRSGKKVDDAIFEIQEQILNRDGISGSIRELQGTGVGVFVDLSGFPRKRQQSFIQWVRSQDAGDVVLPLQKGAGEGRYGYLLCLAA